MAAPQLGGGHSRVNAVVVLILFVFRLLLFSLFRAAKKLPLPLDWQYHSGGDEGRPLGCL